MVSQPNTNLDNPKQSIDTSLQTLLSMCRYGFPLPINADPEGTGFIAAGADLSPPTLLTAYSQGMFPWFNSDDDPIAWWSPEPRCVLVPNEFTPSKSLTKQAKKSDWLVSVNTDFEQVIFNCTLPRRFEGEDVNETWITDEMQSAYLQLHDLGFAHSVEIWNNSKTELLGGLYGLKIGGVFFGESMFHRASNASKMAFWKLCNLCTKTEVELIDCQLPNDHLLSLGASIVKREPFLQELNQLVTKPNTDWQNIKDTLANELIS